MTDAIQIELLRAGRMDVSILARPTRGTGRLSISLLYTMGFASRLVYGAISRSVDVVHLNISQRGSVWRKAFLGYISDMLGLPYIIHLHGSEFHTWWATLGAMEKRLLSRFFIRARMVLVLGHFWKCLLQELFPALGDRLRLLPNACAICPDKVRQDDDCRILFLGAVGERKGAFNLVESWARLAPLLGWTAILAGDGELDTAKELVRKFGLEQRVQVSGWMAGDAVANLLRDSDILVLPSRNENLPMSIIEAMANGLAVVATPVGSVPDLIQDGRTGLLVPVDDVTALANVQAKLVASPALRMRLGRAAQDYQRQHFSLNVYVEKIVGLWAEAASKRPAQ